MRLKLNDILNCVRVMRQNYAFRTLDNLIFIMIFRRLGFSLRPMRVLKAAAVGAMCVICSTSPALAQDFKVFNTSQFVHEIQRLPVCEAVLYVAAHPDDENTRLISTLANEGGYRVAYLSLTRGDGGQNLIGKEIYEELGIIRTEELLSARRLDGAEQFFTRAYDFGYSKTADETLKKWDKNLVLADMVRVIRQFQPDVIITRFPPDSRAGHGHHTVSAMLAEEAMDLAADPKAFPEQLKTLKPWRVKRFYFNASTFFNPDLENYFKKEGIPDHHWTKVNIGGFSPLLGQSWSEIAAFSRSKHRSQGFGSAPARGERFDYLQWKKGEEPTEKNNIFPDSKRVPEFRNKQALEVWHNTTASLASSNSLSLGDYADDLLKLYRLLKENGNPADPVVAYKIEAITNLLANVAGIFPELRTDKPFAAPRDSIKLNIRWISRNQPSSLLSVDWPEGNLKYKGRLNGAVNQGMELDTLLRCTDNVHWPTQHWLRKPIKNELFEFEDESLSIYPALDFPGNARIAFEFRNEKFSLRVPVNYYFVDPAQGEIEQKFRILPPVSIELPETPILLKDGESQVFRFKVKALKEIEKLKIFLYPNDGFLFSQENFVIDKLATGEALTLSTTITRKGKIDQGAIIRIAAEGGLLKSSYSWTVRELNYPHITHQYILKAAAQKIVPIDIATPPLNIGFIEGAGESTVEAMRSIGYNLKTIRPDEITPAMLTGFQTIVLGIRAFNSVSELQGKKNVLFDWVKNGGTLIVQYHTNRGLDSLSISPLPMQVSRVRVTEENAEMKMLIPEHPVFNYPNKISSADFNGWVQERGLYFANKWDAAFQAPLAGHDAGEPEQSGGLLIAPYGKGFYVYTGLAFFRQLPAGAPGAYRLFVNLLHTGHGK